MITVEDYNSFIAKYGIHNQYHHIDTGLGGTEDYSDVMIDFCTVSKSTNGNNISFTFVIDNTAWTGGYYFLDSEGEYIDSDATSSSGNTITFTYTSDVTLVLHCCNLRRSGAVRRYTRLTYIMLSENVVYEVDGVFPTSYEFKDLTDGTTFDMEVTSGDNGLHFFYNDYNHCVYCFKTLRKIVLDLSNVELYAGQVNQIPKPADAGKINLSYLDKTETFDLSSVSYLTIDLSGVYNLTSVDVNVHVYATATDYENITSYTVPIVPLQVTNYQGLVDAIQNNNSVIVYNGNDDWTDNIIISNDTLIKAPSNADNVELAMNGHGFIIGEGVTLKLQGLNVSEGNPAILQGKNSKVELTNCTFTNCSNEDNANLGSVICCDLDTDSLNYTDDYTTNIIDCTFTDNHNCILHGGALNVVTSTYTNNDMSYTVPNNPAFLFQVDGNAIITDSSFDIDYGEQGDYSEKPIMYAQALFMIGETASVNNALYSDLGEDNKVNWHNNPYNNRSHLYCKYYYPSLQTIVYSTPTTGYESKSMCYALSGVDWVFKENVTITRAED